MTLFLIGYAAAALITFCVMIIANLRAFTDSEFFYHIGAAIFWPFTVLLYIIIAIDGLIEKRKEGA